MKQNIIITLLIITGLLTSCGIYPSALFEKLPHTEYPFSLAQKGHVLNANFEASANQIKTYRYTFYLCFLPKDNATEYQRVIKLLGAEDPLNGASTPNGAGIHRTGINIPLRLTIVRLDKGNETVVYKQEVYQLWTLGFGGGTYLKAIDKVSLEPALYRVKLETLAAVPELANVPVRLEVGLPGKH